MKEQISQVVAGGIQSDLAFWGVLMMWELGYFPLRRVAWRPRMIRAAARRWRELVDQVPVLFARDPVDRLAEGMGAGT